MQKITHALGWHFVDLSDFEIRLVIEGRRMPPDKKHKTEWWLGGPFSWKRARKVITIAGHSSIGLTSEAKAWAKEASTQLALQWSRVFAEAIPKSVPVNAAIVNYLPTRRLTDASNLYQGPEDVMQACGPHCKASCKVHAGVLEDDVCIESHDGSARFFDKHNPRVEIVLTPAPVRSFAATRTAQPELEF